MRLAENADRIIAARLRGVKPADMVIVSTVGPLWVANPVVFARPGEPYDWRWVRGLDLCLYADDDAHAWGALLKQIALHRPEHLNVWSHTGQWGAKVYLVPTADDVALPVRRWQYELDFLPWMQFQNEGFKCA